ncbi:acyl carrier protein [Gordonia sp. TBRC 11910]|uniref:Acyl carrier protein n=1 Tax=Gordonia asplenii TaxID=2725283 RepID=A0A848KWC1_9ACTN|nr:acyl carrier protein [Gordonia asplenii]NMO02890.1 acyl carrier protein [Gordonia asplenii]
MDTQKIRDALAQHGKLAVDAWTIDTSADLFEAGLTSHASVNVMLALEDDFDIEFPDEDLKKATFASIDNLSAVITKLLDDAA